jgi:hypothetical protein
LGSTDVNDHAYPPPRAAYGERKTAQPDGNARPAGFSCEEVQTM